MFIKNLHYATVIDNDSQNSPDAVKNDAVQIRISYLMDGIADIDLPWALPFHTSTGGSSSHGTSCIPEENSLVWVFFYDDKLMKDLYYIADINLTNFSPAELFENNVKSNISGYSSLYPDNKFIYLSNGVCIVISSNSSTPEIAIYHPGGAYIFINSSGNIELKGANGSTLEFMLLASSFISVLTTFLNSCTSASGDAAPVAAAATAFLNSLTANNNYLSQTVKNN